MHPSNTLVLLGDSTRGPSRETLHDVENTYGDTKGGYYCPLSAGRFSAGIAQVGYGSRFHHRQYPYGAVGFKPDSDSRCTYVRIVIS